ncbi:HNH endonuclease [Succinivibrio dextrinosolvens]|uniref:HNH endonuclease n=1 Tax=Succinivibrio dextrinosolvens TaxID=83771 RepID=UPI0008E349E9|nr:HNH endonuclease signature motif containing protein [Succinivibrio dextrinosolvens]SFS31497.1 HNH endonuclease [Succinivibrio dextrinosolvens]
MEKLKKSYETLKKSTREKKVITTTTQNKERKKLIGDIVKEIANGVCQLCNQPAPFVNKDQRPYLECHHVQWLERGGADDVYNAVAICPNCHKKMHILDLEQDVKKLEKVANKNMTSFNEYKKS